jgi:hypothetical protein
VRKKRAPYSTTASHSTSVEERLSLSLSHLLAHKTTIITRRSKIREIATSCKQSSRESRIASLILCCCSRRHSRALTGTRTLEDHASWRSKHRLVDPATQCCPSSRLAISTRAVGKKKKKGTALLLCCFSVFCCASSTEEQRWRLWLLPRRRCTCRRRCCHVEEEEEEEEQRRRRRGVAAPPRNFRSSLLSWCRRRRRRRRGAFRA